MSYFCNAAVAMGTSTSVVIRKWRLSVSCMLWRAESTEAAGFLKFLFCSQLHKLWLISFCKTDSQCDTVLATHDCLVCEKQLQPYTDWNRNSGYLYRVIVLFDPYRSSLPAAVAYCRDSTFTYFSSVCCSCGIWRRCLLTVRSFGSHNRVTTNRYVNCTCNFSS